MSHYPNVLEALEKHQIILDVIPQEFVPTAHLIISYDGEAVLLGNELLASATQSEPEFSLSSVIDEFRDSTYTLAMLDPDAPSRADPKFGPFRHWVLTGLQLPQPPENERDGYEEEDEDDAAGFPQAPSTMVRTTEAITPYRGPGPPPGSGLHRYVFLLFREPKGGIKLPSDAPEHGSEREQRRKWSGIDFGNRHGLTLVAANFFLVRGEETSSS